MAVAPIEALSWTPEDLLIREREGRFELVDGQLREKPPMGAEANRIATVIVRRIDAHASERRLGLCFSQECGYQIFPHDSRRVRYPDGSFVRNGRLPGNRPPRGHMKIVPDLVIEVVSPNDLAEILDERLTDFLGAGVPLIWVVFPLTRHIQVYRGDGSGSRIGPGGTLDGERVLPGFSCPIGELFAVIDGDGDGDAPDEPGAPPEGPGDRPAGEPAP